MRGDIKNCGHKFIPKTDRTRLIKIYNGMKARCYNIKSISYKYYGKRGIKICKRWLDKEKGFERFYKWSINNGYKDGLTIDRINNKKNYTPQNCRWVDMITQNNNRNICKYIIYNEKKQTISQWAKEFGISRYELIKEIKEKGEQKAIERFLYNVK